jgi:hypothetical protein
VHLSVSTATIDVVVVSKRVGAVHLNRLREFVILRLKISAMKSIAPISWHCSRRPRFAQ